MNKGDQQKMIDGVKVFYPKGYRITQARERAIKRAIPLVSEIYKRKTFCVFLNLRGYGKKDQISVVFIADMYGDD